MVYLCGRWARLRTMTTTACWVGAWPLTSDKPESKSQPPQAWLPASGTLRSHIWKWGQCSGGGCGQAACFAQSWSAVAMLVAITTVIHDRWAQGLARLTGTRKPLHRGRSFQGT